ncbi:MAG TPA: MarR family winged helix-turn-helix transcriptional regulator [Polyangia bacterium]|nr:MarR family winged helix-turn-helix transcriptional regulator [Polyangia bacterium]
MSSEAHRCAAEMARDCMASRVRRLERLLTRIYDDAIRDQGLTGSQMELLAAVQLSGPTTAAAVGRLLELEKSTVSRNLARLAAAGLVDVSDGLAITPRGSAAIAACHPAWQAAQRRARKVLQPAESRLIARLERRSTEPQSEKGRRP